MGPVWRFTVRDTSNLQTTLTLGPVNRQGQTLSLELGLQMSLPLPDQDEHLPDQIEAFVHHAGLEVQRRLFQLLRFYLCTFSAPCAHIFRLLKPRERQLREARSDTAARPPRAIGGLFG